MIIDKHGFLSFSSDITNPKIYTHTIAGQNFSDTDHLVLIRHKGEVKVLNRKDLGKTMNIIFINTTSYLHKQESKNAISFFNPLTLFSGYDENIRSEYFFSPKIHGEKLQHIAEKLHTIKIIDQTKGWFQIIQQADEANNLLYQLFTLYTIVGKSLLKGNLLSSLKIQLRIPTPFFSCKDTIDSFIKNLQQSGYTIAGYFLQQNNGGTYEITTNDYEILDYIRQHDKSLASVEKIVTKELADQVSILLGEQYPESKDIIGDGGIKLWEVK